MAARRITKAQAVQLLGGNPPTQAGLAQRLGVTRQAVHAWPDVLTVRIEGRVLGCLWREAEAQHSERHQQRNAYVPDAPKRHHGNGRRAR